jgi:PAS domain-containing protein
LSYGAIGRLCRLTSAKNENLFQEKERAQVTLDSIGDAVVSTDVGGHVTYLNLVADVVKVVVA